MIKIHVTKKLLAKLLLDKSNVLGSERKLPANRPTDHAGLGDWHANLITLQRHNCILFVHDATRFPVFIKELRKPDFANLSWHFEDGFMNTLLKLDASNEQMDTAASVLRPLHIDTDCNRSVQGTMNHMAGDINHVLWYNNASLQDTSAYRTGAWLADRPCTVKGLKDCIWPNKAMLSLLDGIAKCRELGNNLDKTTENANAKNSDNIISLDKYR